MVGLHSVPNGYFSHMAGNPVTAGVRIMDREAISSISASPPVKPLLLPHVFLCFGPVLCIGLGVGVSAGPFVLRPSSVGGVYVWWSCLACGGLLGWW